MSSRTILGATLTAAIVTAWVGCTPNRPSILKREGEPFLGRLGGSGGGGAGQIIEPKRCLISVLIVPRPLHDAVVNASVWATADEQSVPSETRRVLEANGLRVGVLTGGLPPEVEAAIHAPPPNTIEPTEFNLPDGSPTLITLAASRPTASLLLNHDGRALGKDYADASGWFRLTASHDGPTGVSLRFVPEIHHGPVLRRFDAAPNNAGNFNAMPYSLKDGQEEDTLRELAATVRLEPGQVAVVGCLPDRKGSLGTFLFTQAETSSDRLSQKLLLVRVTRSSPGIPGSMPKPGSPLEPVEPPDLPAAVEPNKNKDKNKDVGKDPARDPKAKGEAVKS